MKLEIHRLCCGYSPQKPILDNISFCVESGEICCLIGPNGVGKTTLFKSIMGFIKPLGGEIRINGENITRWSAQRRARAIAYVAQQHTPPFPYMVKDVVMLGRISSTGYLGQPKQHDFDAANAAMAEMGILDFADRAYTELSGGERQLVMLARALAQEPQLLVLDEPTANLDYGNMLKVLRHICALRDKGYAVIMTTHMPDQAFLCKASVLLLGRGSKPQFGFAASIMTERSLSELYGVRVKVVEYDPEGVQLRLCAPLFESIGGYNGE